jgi:SAM-dependent methyltransferase
VPRPAPLGHLTRAALGHLKRSLLSFAYRGTAVECPVCERRFLGFRPHGGRPGRLCPYCSSLPRHRLFWLWLREQAVQGDVLHVAPEWGIEQRLRGPGYVSTDLHGGMVKADLQDLPFDDDSFDWIICNHVLSYVPDDERAISELRRVLRSSGVLLMQNPIDRSQARSYEGPDLRYGIRRYGRDLYSKLRRAGFEVKTVRFIECMPPAMVKRMRLGSHAVKATGDDILVCQPAPREAAIRTAGELVTPQTQRS